MAVNLVTITGTMEMPTGVTPSSGLLRFRLNRSDWNAAGNIFAPEFVTATADPTTGAFSVDLQSTDDFEVGATYTAIQKYRDTVTGWDREYELGAFAAPDGGPYLLTDLLAVPVVEPVPADVLALAQAAQVAAEQSADDAQAAQAASQAISDEFGDLASAMAEIDAAVVQTGEDRDAVEAINAALSADGGPVSLNGVQTVTNKTINLGSNTLVATSAQMAAAVTDETGSGALVFGTSPTIASLLMTGAPRAYGLTSDGMGQFLTDLKLGPIFASRSEAENASTGRTGSVSVITVMVGGRPVTYAYSATGTALTTGDGRTWMPAGVWTPDHFGGRTSAAINAAIQGAAVADVSTVWLVPDGTQYAVSAPIVLDQPVTLAQQGGNSTILLNVTATIADIIQISHHRACVVGVTFDGNDIATNFVHVEDTGSGDASIRVMGCRGSSVGRFLDNEQFDGLHVIGNHCVGATIENVRLQGGGTNSIIAENYFYSFSGGGDGLLIEDGTHQTEGLIVKNNTWLNPGGRPFTIEGGLYLRFSNNIWDQCYEGGIINPTVSLTDVLFSGDWIGAAGGAPAASAVKLSGSNADIRFEGCTLLGMAAPILLIDGSGNQNIRVLNCKLRSTGSTSATIGIQNDSGRACVVENTSFDLAVGAVSIVEDASAVTVYRGNRLANGLTGSTVSTLSWLMHNYGFGSGTTTGAHSLYLGAGSVSDPSLAFQIDAIAGVNTGWSRVTDGWAWNQNGVEVIRLDLNGMQIGRTDGIRGNSANIVDDGVTSFTPPNTTGKILVTIDEGACEYSYRVGAGAHCSISDAAPLAQFDVTTGVLTGTTGVDNNITLSSHTDGLIYIENRRGSTKAVRVSVRY